MKVLGSHIVADLWGCRPEPLNDAEAIRQYARMACELSGAKIIDDIIHQFSPQGVTVIVGIEESHLSIHTWPEEGYVALDYFTCGDRVVGRLAIEHLLVYFNPSWKEITTIDRGISRIGFT